RNPYATHACIADDLPAHDGEHITVPASLENGMGAQLLRHQNQFTRLGHLEWLQHTRMDYLTTTPQWFEAVLNDARLHHIELPEIRQLLTYGATAPSTLRTKARKQLGASVRHRYTCLECGPLAFQCPRSDDFYHVAVANVLLEVVDAAGQPCPAADDASTAQTGRVLVTALHQYATPMLRHDIGDRAALLNHCPGCGLDLPTLCRLLQNV
ncbi:MAG: AMP-binding protein, partial [Rhodoferax sp.]|nr:AMP-binding protein [Rhodoferax sp.]